MLRCIPAALLITFVACGSPDQVAPTADYTAPSAVATVSDSRLREISGLAASHKNLGHYYVHNDSGDSARVFLIDRQGAVAAVITLAGVRAVDFEDIALAPGQEEGTWDVCVADIGDNHATRPHVVIYRFPEIDLAQSDDTTPNARPTAYRVRYPIGPVNAEAFCVHPHSGTAYILTKQPTGGSTVFKLSAPWPDDQTVTLARVGELQMPPAALAGRIVTAADIAPDGRRLAVRCYLDGWEWTPVDGTSPDSFSEVFGTSPQALALHEEQQGEALGYAADGRALLTISEGTGQKLYEVRHPAQSEPEQP